MVDVSSKDKIKNNLIPKGNPMDTARIAVVMAAKKNTCVNTHVSFSCDYSY